MSVVARNVLTPYSFASLRVSRPPFSSRSRIPTLAPSRAAHAAIARPMPCAAPVTSTTSSASRPSRIASWYDRYMSTNGSVYEVGAALSGGGQIPLLGFGTWQLRGDEARQAVEWALEAGYRHLDSATGYRNQTEVGAALKASGLPRESVFVTTKLPPDHVDRERKTLEESLSELGLDHLDLWLIHWPPGGEAGV